MHGKRRWRVCKKPGITILEAIIINHCLVIETFMTKKAK